MGITSINSFKKLLLKELENNKDDKGKVFESNKNILFEILRKKSVRILNKIFKDYEINDKKIKKFIKEKYIVSKDVSYLNLWKLVNSIMTLDDFDINKLDEIEKRIYRIIIKECINNIDALDETNEREMKDNYIRNKNIMVKRSKNIFYKININNVPYFTTTVDNNIVYDKYGKKKGIYHKKFNTIELF